MNNTTIGWIGLGNMGNPMSQQLIKAGYAVTVYNRSKDKAATIQSLGAATANTPQQLLQQTDTVFIMVSNDAAIEDIFDGPTGLLAAGVKGKLIINMSTVSPAISKEMAAQCAAQGNVYLDAPVSGSVKQAQDAQLVIMVGGEKDAFEKAKPILDKLGKLTMHIGSTGAGNTAKLAINLLLGMHAQALAEALTFAQQHGVQAADFTAILNNSTLGNPFAKIKGEAILNNNYQAAFALKHIAKDLRLAKAEGFSTPLAATALQTYQQAEAAFGEEDIIAVIKQFAK
ncbi:NAD(P)-dependent oxidoreductase [Deminuibacter soli]|uniref:NAD(P)-dependent oxidoreductase n=2 Tax=Deminuibacter soli TaxID=2291815 RepID=A0A3E1NHF2_9BACT|nr:NAD(P)-dependent oxidoreductase [Deminuibacter soli]